MQMCAKSVWGIFRACFFLKGYYGSKDQHLQKAEAQVRRRLCSKQPSDEYAPDGEVWDHIEVAAAKCFFGVIRMH